MPACPAIGFDTFIDTCADDRSRTSAATRDLMVPRSRTRPAVHSRSRTSATPAGNPLRIHPHGRPLASRTGQSPVGMSSQDGRDNPELTPLNLK